MTQLTPDSVVLVPVVRVLLSLQPLPPCRVVFDLGLSRVELSLSMLELLEVHALNTVSAKSHILRHQKIRMPPRSVSPPWLVFSRVVPVLGCSTRYPNAFEQVLQ